MARLGAFCFPGTGHINRIAGFAQAHREASAPDLNRMLLEEADAFCGSRFQDDATLLVIAAT